MRRHTMFLTITALLSLCSPVVIAEEKKADEPNASDVMKEKLKHAQLILEGITINDFEKVSKGSEGLLAASKKAAWKIVQTPDYQLHSDTFRRACGDLIAASKKKNVEKAALAYVDLTLTCVKCHQHVREQGIGLQLDPFEWPRTRETVPTE